MSKEREKRARLRSRHRELLEIESALWLHGMTIAGVDEAGAGPLAGPVVAACVVLDPDGARALEGVDDSKALTESLRLELAERIRSQARAVVVREASVQEIDILNIREAGLLAMKRALDGVLEQLDIHHLLVDARTIPQTRIAQSNIIRGDGRSLSIAAASIMAKVSRDQAMIEAAGLFPHYGFDRHKGYGTREHLDAIARWGVCPLHRRSFAPVREAIQQLGLFD